MKQHKGFTLIELMIVIAIMGILAIIAIPMYVDYTIRARVSEGMHLSSSAKLAVAEIYNASGNFASDNPGYGLPASSAIHGNHVSSISAGTNGDITITFRGNLGRLLMVHWCGPVMTPLERWTVPCPANTVPQTAVHSFLETVSGNVPETGHFFVPR